MSAPNASERKACWTARDELWRCLDDNNDQAAVCDRFQKDMDANCPMQWVRHFAKRRDFLKYKAKMEKEGFMPADGPKVSS